MNKFRTGSLVRHSKSKELVFRVVDELTSVPSGGPSLYSCAPLAGDRRRRYKYHERDLCLADRKGVRRLMITAYHEAGHAVAAVEYDQPFKHVTIESNLESLGHLLHHSYPRWFRPDIRITPRVRERLEGRIVTLFSGGLAERRFSGRKGVSAGSWNDHKIALDLASHAAGSDRSLRRYLDWLWTVAEDFVTCAPFWQQIEAVAEALAQRRRLRATEVRKITLDCS